MREYKRSVTVKDGNVERALRKFKKKIQEQPSELDVQGPVPNRKTPFYAEILEKLVLRRPNEVKLAELEDLRVRACLNKARLPSALCFTFLNIYKIKICATA